jgi:dipeptidyl aminopeptidase/acylaminoacyl peptidase
MNKKLLSPLRFTTAFLLLLAMTTGGMLSGQSTDSSLSTEVKALQAKLNDVSFDVVSIQKAVDDIYWYNRVGDVAFIDKVYITGPPVAKPKNPDAVGAFNPVKFYCYIFIPKGLNGNKKYPLLIFPHGGVHGNFDTYYAHIVREMMAQGYIVAAPEYRGSTGYGEDFYKKIDYGGREIDDVDASRNYMVRNYEMVDSTRVGIVGWSHGGLIALMAVFDHPENYQVCFAGVPVSDLIQRMGYSDDDYRKDFSADYHIGKTPKEDLAEYKRRSPVWNAQKLKTPLLIHTNTNDDDVYVIEVEHLIQALKAEGKTFSYEVFKDIEGGHSFDRIDTHIAKEIRLKIYTFLDKYLDPPRKLKTIEEMNTAAYRP